MTLLSDKIPRKSTSEKNEKSANSNASTESGDDSKKGEGENKKIGKEPYGGKEEKKEGDPKPKNSIPKKKNGGQNSERVPVLIKHVSVYFDNGNPSEENRRKGLDSSEGSRARKTILRPPSRTRRQSERESKPFNLSTQISRGGKEGADDKKGKNSLRKSVHFASTASTKTIAPTSPTKMSPTKTFNVKKSPASVSLGGKEMLTIKGKKIVCFDKGDRNSSVDSDNEYVDLCQEERDSPGQSQGEEFLDSRKSFTKFQQAETATRRVRPSEIPVKKNRPEGTEEIQKCWTTEDIFEKTESTILMEISPIEESGGKDLEDSNSSGKMEGEEKKEKETEFVPVQAKEAAGWKFANFLPYWHTTEINSPTIVSKAKTLDLEKVDIFNLTSLTSGENLQKLKSFHEQTVSIKRSSFQEKAPASNPKSSEKNSKFGSKTAESTWTEEEKEAVKRTGNTSSKVKLISRKDPRENLRGLSSEPGFQSKVKNNLRPSSSGSNKTFKCEKTMGRCEKPPTGRESGVKSKERLSYKWSGSKLKRGSAKEIKPSKADSNGSFSSKLSAKGSKGSSDSFKRNPTPKSSARRVKEEISPGKSGAEPNQGVTNSRPSTREISNRRRNSGCLEKAPKETESGQVLEKDKEEVKVEEKKEEEGGLFDSITKFRSEPNWNPDGCEDNLAVRGESLDLKGIDSEEESKKVRLEIKIDLNDRGVVSSENLIQEVKEPESAEFENFKVLKRGKFEAEDRNSSEVCNNDLPLDDYDEEADPVWNRTKNSKATTERESSADSVSLKAYRSSSSIKRKPKYNSSATRVKARAKKQKANSYSRYHSLLFGSGHFNSVTSFPNKGKKVKPEAKVRSGLTRAINQDGIVDGDLNYLFEEAAAAVNLKRRNSEPNSFRGFIWKQPELAIFGSNKASASSMASSLRHMNADELEDFRVWEAAPLNMTSCWEMSLYHCRRPWSVLSCSVFKDNRMSATPGIILESLRNGGALHLSGSQFSDKERIGSQTDNSFDVEPSIAQKNIDIRNWLSALNFPTPPPSTSNDAIIESYSQGPTATNLGNINQIASKRKKVLRNLNYSEEGLKKKFENNGNWASDKTGDLMELIRRKSGGYVAEERYAGTNHSQYVAIVNGESRSGFQELVGRQVPETDLGAHQTKSDALQLSSRQKDEEVFQPAEEFVECEEKSNESNRFAEEEVPAQTKSRVDHQLTRSGNLVRFFKGETNVNIWKYLFILSLSLFLYHLLNARQVQH